MAVILLPRAKTQRIGAWRGVGREAVIPTAAHALTLLLCVDRFTYSPQPTTTQQ